VCFWFTVPPRHGKTELLAHHIARLLLHDPAAPLIYCAHTATWANKVSKRTKALTRAAGVQLATGSNRADEWETVAGGGLVARGVGGEVTGRGARHIFVDDPVKGREVANSQVQRDGVWDWALTDVFSRLAPGGSFFLVHTRWNTDDPIGRAERELGWPGVTLRAIAEPGDTDGRAPGEALWPEGGWTAERFAEIERTVGAYRWASLYQGRPMPRGGTLFGEPSYYDKLPASGYRVAYGLDLAYTAKTSADWSVCLRLLADGDTYYVVEVQRKQVKAPDFMLTLKAMHAAQPGRMLWHIGGTEKGTVDFIRKRLPALETRPATTDKFARAQDVAAAWNDGRVLLPSEAHCERNRGDWSWVDPFIAELGNFTGVNDLHDDQVDALASAHHAVKRPRQNALDMLRKWRGNSPRRM
jgi:predicted phage terminase large subunit-like protein